MATKLPAVKGEDRSNATYIGPPQDYLYGVEPEEGRSYVVIDEEEPGRVPVHRQYLRMGYRIDGKFFNDTVIVMSIDNETRAAIIKRDQDLCIERRKATGEENESMSTQRIALGDFADDANSMTI